MFLGLTNTNKIISNSPITIRYQTCWKVKLCSQAMSVIRTDNAEIKRVLRKISQSETFVFSKSLQKINSYPFWLPQKVGESVTDIRSYKLYKICQTLGCALSDRTSMTDSFNMSEMHSSIHCFTITTQHTVTIDTFFQAIPDTTYQSMGKDTLKKREFSEHEPHQPLVNSETAAKVNLNR